MEHKLLDAMRFLRIEGGEASPAELLVDGVITAEDLQRKLHAENRTFIFFCDDAQEVKPLLQQREIYVDEAARERSLLPLDAPSACKPLALIITKRELLRGVDFRAQKSGLVLILCEAMHNKGELK